MRGSGRCWAVCRPTRARGPSKDVSSMNDPQNIICRENQETYLNEADPVFMVNIMWHEDLWHPRHVLVKVIHVLNLHGIEERVRLREIRGTTEAIGWREHRRCLLCPTEHPHTANAGGTRGHSTSVLVARLPVWRRGSRQRRRSTGRIDHARDTTGDGTGVRRWITGSVPVRPTRKG